MNAPQRSPALDGDRTPLCYNEPSPQHSCAMTHSPDPFSTEGGLNRSVVAEWVRTNNQSDVARWLASGNKHPRLATQAIYEAVAEGHLEMAEQVWQAGWHTMPTALEVAWDYLRCNRAQQSFHASQNQPAIEWLIQKSLPLPGKKISGVQNAGLMAGLAYAFHSNDHGLWQRLFETGATCEGSAGYDVFIGLSHYCSWMDASKKDPTRIPDWAQAHALDDLLDHGLRIGGDLWIESMRQPQAEQVFEALVSRAEQLTTPRQRSAIVALAQAYNLIPERKERVEYAFFGLGLAHIIALTPSEAKKCRSKFDINDTVLANSSRPFITLPNPQQETLHLVEGKMNLEQAFPPEARAHVRSQLLDRTISLQSAHHAPKPRF